MTDSRANLYPGMGPDEYVNPFRHMTMHERLEEIARLDPARDDDAPASVADRSDNPRATFRRAPMTTYERWCLALGFLHLAVIAAVAIIAVVKLP